MLVCVSIAREMHISVAAVVAAAATIATATAIVTATTTARAIATATAAVGWRACDCVLFVLEICGRSSTCIGVMAVTQLRC